MKHIYNTHTKYTNLSVDEIIKKAIAEKCQTIGFVNIAPSRFGDDKMTFASAEELIKWIDEMQEVKVTYKDEIKVLTGIELNFLDRFTGEIDIPLVEKIARLEKVDYLLFSHHYYPGQEYLGDVKINDDNRVALKYSMEEMFSVYPFKYICHPALFLQGHKKWDRYSEQMAYDLVKFAKIHDVILEMPYDTFDAQNYDLYVNFWKIVAETKVKVHLDLNSKMINFFTKDDVIFAEKEAKKLGINLIEKIF